MAKGVRRWFTRRFREGRDALQQELYLPILQSGGVTVDTLPRILERMVVLLEHARALAATGRFEARLAPFTIPFLHSVVRALFLAVIADTPAARLPALVTA